jgi:NADH dehydrogenase
MSPGKVSITGAFSYSGAYIAEAYLAAGWEVQTLTRNPLRPHRLQGKIASFPLDFQNSDELIESLNGVAVLINTYWVRFDYQHSSFEQAINNSELLFNAAKIAGVKRIIHLSVSNPSFDSELPYYAGKARVEELLEESGLAHSILRPTLIFGEEELLVNNIAWLMRKMPLFPIAGDGTFRLQPIYVRDLAKMALEEANKKTNRILNAAASEVLSYRQLLEILKRISNSRSLFFQVPPWIAIALARLMSFVLRDVLLTRDELDGLMQERLYVGDECTKGVEFSRWAQENRQLLGRKYTNEISRHHQSS